MFAPLKKFFGTATASSQTQGWSPPPRIPDQTQVYVVGDIHGRLDLLRRMHDLIKQDATPLDTSVRRIVIYLGDYIDRSEASKGVLDLLLEEPLSDFEVIHLKGNHEAGLENFLANPSPDHPWIVFGGLSTVLSYGVRMSPQAPSMAYAEQLRDALLNAIPETHKMFFAELRMRLQIGDYFLVHAGIRPGVDLAKQHPSDLLGIREPFLSSKQIYEKFIVHGHTDTDKPSILPNRIGIDTGAYYTGRLTCLVLAGEQQRFLTT